MKHYRINKLAKRGGPVVKYKDILARDDADAVRTAEESPDCPVCDILHAGAVIAAVDHSEE